MYYRIALSYFALAYKRAKQKKANYYKYKYAVHQQWNTILDIHTCKYDHDDADVAGMST